MSTGAVAFKSPGVLPRHIHNDIGESDGKRSKVDPEFRQDCKAIRVETVSERPAEIEGNLPVGARATCHHDNAPSIKLIALLSFLHPGKKRLLIHVHRKLDVHFGAPPLTKL